MLIDMKKLVLFMSFLALMNFMSTAQNELNLHIQHKVGETDFAFNLPTQNNLKHDLKFTRVQYYISEIVITHDGGMETKIKDIWVLVDAGQETTVSLGSFDINQVEKFKFHIGVDEDHNHGDPSAYQGGHPLAPKFPSMHWGWAAGYRFIALEGMGGSNFNQVFQLHGLGDVNYFDTEFDMNVAAVNGQIQIGIVADYARALENIGVNGGVIVHGENNEARTAMENFRDYVFTVADISSATTNTEMSALDVVVYPNPGKDGMTRIFTGADYDRNFNLELTDLYGKTIRSVSKIKGGEAVQLDGLEAGVYVLVIMENGRAVQQKKLIIQ
jgi:hypothetical protein